MDLLDDEMEEELKPGVIGRKKRREILGVLIGQVWDGGGPQAGFGRG